MNYSYIGDMIDDYLIALGRRILEQYNPNNGERQRITSKISNINKKLEAVKAGTNDGMPKGYGINVTEEALIALLEKKQELESELNYIIDINSFVGSVMRKLSNQERKLIYLHYLDDKDYYSENEEELKSAKSAILKFTVEAVKKNYRKY